MSQATKGQIAAARRIHQTEECEIDDNAEESRGDEAGAWVQAWVWVPDSEIPESERPED